MTTIQKSLIAAALAVVAGAGIYEAHQVFNFPKPSSKPGPESPAVATRARRSDEPAGHCAAELAKVRKSPPEVIKLRGEVGALRQEKANAGSQSALNKLTANPETRKVLRDQQKMGMTAIYADLAKRLNLSPEKAGQFNDLLADHIMDGVDLTTQALHDNRTRSEIDQLFSTQNSAFQEQVQALLGPDGLAQYQDYTKNLDSTLTAAQFAGNLTGDPAMVADKKSQLTQAMQQATQSALTAAGLPSDYQAIPMLNFANIASAEEGAQNVQLLDNIYGQVAANAGSFLSPEELAKFQEFRSNAIQSSQAQFIMNRQLMAPISQ